MQCLQIAAVATCDWAAGVEMHRPRSWPSIKGTQSRALWRAAKPMHACVSRVVTWRRCVRLDRVNMYTALSMAWRCMVASTPCCCARVPYTCTLSHGRFPTDGILANHPHICELLLNARSNPNHRDADGRNAGHLSAFHQTWEIIPLLFEYGLDVMQKDNEGRLLLHWAAINDRYVTPHVLRVAPLNVLDVLLLLLTMAVASPWLLACTLLHVAAPCHNSYTASRVCSLEVPCTSLCVFVKQWRAVTRCWYMNIGCVQACTHTLPWRVSKQGWQYEPAAALNACHRACCNRALNSNKYLIYILY